MEWDVFPGVILEAGVSCLAYQLMMINNMPGWIGGSEVTLESLGC